MNKDILQGQWTQLKGRIRKQWGKLTDDDVDQVQGDAEVLSGKIQERYRRTKDEARKGSRALLRQYLSGTPQSDASRRVGR